MFHRIVCRFLLLVFLVACSPSAAPPPPPDHPTETPVPIQTVVPTRTPLGRQPTAAPTATPTAKNTIPVSANAKPSATSLATLYPLSQPGPYHSGVRDFIIRDDSRGRELRVSVWYPAVLPAGSTDIRPTRDGEPDRSEAPYPVLLSSAKVGGFFAHYLVSHGFTYIGVGGMDASEYWGNWLVDYPLDLLFALDQVGGNPPEGLEGLLDVERSGALGYSFDGYDALALSGARIDPQYYLEKCAQAPTLQPPVPEWWRNYICRLAPNWEAFRSHAGETLTTSANGLWQPMTDERIRAVMPLAPEGAWLFGERGLAAADRPTLIIAAANDSINDYDMEAVFIYENLGVPEKAMISFLGKGHMMIYDLEPVASMRHFAVAFFGHQLQRRQDYANYYSAEFVAQLPQMAWGVYFDK